MDAGEFPPKTEMKEIAMAKLIQFYTSKNFQGLRSWVPELQHGEVVELTSQTNKAA